MPSLRSLKGDDEELIYRITEAAMRFYVEQSFGPWNEEQQRNITRERIDPATDSIIQVDGVDIGLLTVKRNAEALHLESLFLLPQAQKRGVGTEILRRLQAEARSKGLPLRLRVLLSNPARFWYQREGFAVTQATPERWFMEYRGII